MTGTIFDLIEDKLPEGQEGFMSYAENAPKSNEESFFGMVKDYGEKILGKTKELQKTALKGSVEGLTKLGRLVSPTIERPEELTKQTETLDILLPTKDDFSNKALRRGLNEAPTAIATQGRNLATQGIKALVAGFIGEAGKEMGLPEWGQNALELTAYLGPDLTKKLLSTGKNKDIIDFGKKMGLSDKQITPLIQSEFKQKWLAKLTPRRGSVEKSLEETKKGLGNVYKTLQESEGAAKEILEKDNGKLINGIYQKMNEMPREIRNKIEADLGDLLDNKITGKSLMNFWSDINSKFSGDKKRLSILKEPIKEALQSISPELSKDFEMVNKLYSKYSPIAARLKPTLTTDIVSAAETLGIAGSGIGIIFGHYPSLTVIAGEQAARQIAKQMLINPTFQQISKKMMVAINENKFMLAKKLMDEFKDEISKTDPKTANKLKKLTEKEFEELISNQKD